MRKGNILPIAVMALALVAFLFMLDYSIGSGKWPWSVKTTITKVTTNTVSGTNNGALDIPVSEQCTTNSDCQLTSCGCSSKTFLSTNQNLFMCQAYWEPGTTCACESGKCAIVRAVSTITNSSNNPTGDWKTYTNDDLSFSFKYPKEFGNVSFVIANGETGEKFNGTFSNTTNLDFGGINEAFSEGRGGYFLDTQGYVKVGTTYYYKFVNTSRVNMSVVKEVSGINMTSVLVRGSDENSAANPGTNAIGAVMNLPSNGQFTGLAIRTLDTQKVPQTILEQILSTFTFNK